MIGQLPLFIEYVSSTTGFNQFTMNAKWKIILTVMLIISSVCGVFIALFTFDSRENLKNLTDIEITSIRAIVKTIEEERSHRYQNRIQTFVNYRELPRREKLIRAFARQDREELLRLTAPYLTILRNENPYFSTFSWLTSDNHAFLRVHRPASFGDYIGKMRPDIVGANKDHRQQAGYMVSKTGLQYRLVQPVAYEGKHVGILQFGLKNSMLLDAVYEKLKLPVGMVIPNKKFSFITHSKLPTLAGSTHTIQSKQIDLFQQKNDDIDWSLKQQKVTLQGKTYILANAINLLNYKQEAQGYIFVVLDISKQVKTLQLRIGFILLLSMILLLFSFFILHSSYGNLVQKIIDLNKALRQSNENLEQQVEQRTEKLQKALDEVKTLEGILPLCSYCKKIRNDQDEWEEVDAYIYSHSQADISHSICPKCAEKHFPEYHTKKP